MDLYKRNYIVYFYVYFVAQLIFTYVHVFLPVYFFNVLKVNRAELAFVQIFSYSAFFIKPIIAIYFDKEKATRKLLIIISSVGVLFSFILFILSLNLLIIFGIFLGINFAFLSVVDVSVDKLIVYFSPDEKIKDKNVLCIQLGAMSGAIFPNIIFIIIFTDLYSLNIWNQFFLIGIITTIPVIFLSFLLNTNLEATKENQILEEKKYDIKYMYIFLICIFIFLVYANRLYDYPLEPWFLNKYGEKNFILFTMLLSLLILINALGVVIAGIISNRFDRKKILIYSSISMGIIFIIVPFVDFITFFILFGIIQILAGFLLINLTSIMIDLSQKKVVYYQIMASFAILARVVFLPLGTYLTLYISTEVIIVIAGILTILSVVPLFFIKEDFKQTSAK